ncbi:MAG: YlxR family protein, partial [Candidatus Gastranaerophilales bacterium]|nr:YlxR family protein [Candidatus Gastranaerophilales bacterium]
MSRKDKFLRQCVSCRAFKDKSDLIRITKDYKTQEIKLNYNSEIIGRSVYICKNKECLEKAIKKKKIENFLKAGISEKLKENLNT